MASDGRVLVMPGEGIGPEIVREGRKVLEAAAERGSLSLAIEQFEVGEAAIARGEGPLPPAARAACDRARSDPKAAILFGAVADEPIGILRKDYDLFANLRPIRSIASLAAVSPLKETVFAGIDLLVVRELASGIYYGPSREFGEGRGRTFSQEMLYTDAEMRRITVVALECASRRRKKLVLAHKANVIKGVFGHWLTVLEEEARRFPDVLTSSMLIDALCMQLVRRPTEFDVILAGNMFGDILSDLGAGLIGSIGLLPSSSRNEAGFGLYESIGGTAPDIAGKDVANPASTILSVAMMLRDTFDRGDLAERVEEAVFAVLRRARTPDLYEPGLEQVGTAAFGDAVTAALARVCGQPR